MAPSFPVPTAGGAPYGLTAGPDGAIWFAEFNGNKIGRVTTDGTMAEFPVPTGNSHPSIIAQGFDGNLWFAESQGNKVGRVTTSGTITEFPIPSPGSTPFGLAAGPDGNVWIAESQANKVGRLTADGVVTEFAVPTPNAQPGAITAGPDGALWFTEYTGNKIARVSAAGLITEYAVPTPSSSPNGIATGADGNLWFTETTGNKIGRLTTTGVVTEFSIPTSNSQPLFINAGPDGSLWFSEYNGNKIGRISTDGEIAEFQLGTPHSNPAGINAGADGDMWFAEYSGNAIETIPQGPLHVVDPRHVPGWPAVTEANSIGVLPEAVGAAADNTSLGIIVFDAPDGQRVRFIVCSSDCTGAAGDLSRGSLIEFSEFSTDGTTQNNYPGTTSLDVDPVTVSGSQYAFALYRAPAILPPTGSRPDRPPVVVRLGVQTEAGELLAVRTIVLYAAPVVLTHGIWSKPAVWVDFKSYLYANYGSSGVFAVDYSQSAAKSFLDPANQLAFATAVSRALSSAEDAGIIATRVDVIGHSMGGLLARSWANTYDYLTQDVDYHLGRIYRLISVGTPHSGSLLAKWLHDNGGNPVDPHSLLGLFLPSGTLLSVFMWGVSMDTGAGGVDSLIPGNAALGQLAPETILPFTTVRGFAPSESNQESILNLIAAGFDQIPFPLTQTTVESVLQTTYGEPQQHDTVVDVVSQLGGHLSQPAEQDIIDIVHADVPTPWWLTGAADAPTETNSDAVARELLCLLGGYASPCDAPAMRPETRAAPKSMTTPLWQIDFSTLNRIGPEVLDVSPAPPGPLNTGRETSVSVSCSSKVLSRVIFVVDGQVNDATSAPYTASVRPTEAGSFSLGIVALFDDGSFTEETVTYSAQLPSGDAWLAADPPGVRLFGIASALPLKVGLNYVDGTTIDVTRTASYSVRGGGLNVIMVLPSGVLVATGYGRAVVDISFEGLSASVGIAVVPQLPGEPPTCALIMTAPSSVCPLSAGNIASVPDAGSGATYSWSIVNGTIDGGDGTTAISFTAAGNGAVTLAVAVEDSTGCVAGTARAVAVPAPLDQVDVTASGPTTVCQAGAAGTLTAADGSVGPGSHQWGYRTVSGGTINPISGATGLAYMIEGADFPGPGSFYLVEETTPACGAPVVSNEISATVLPATAPPPPNMSVTACLPSNQSGVVASVPPASGHTYVWSVTGTTITSGQGTSSVTFASGPPGNQISISVNDTDQGGCVSVPTQDFLQVDFSDEPAANIFYPFVCKVGRHGITAGCGAGNYCPSTSVTRAQMAVFLLKSIHGRAFQPPACTGVFDDVPCPYGFAVNWIEELYHEGITGGCGADNFCPTNPVTRAQMAVFLLKAEHGTGYAPPACTGIFADVECTPTPAFAVNWIEELYSELITGGCATNPLRYCPSNPNTRGQMAVFLAKTFQLQ